MNKEYTFQLKGKIVVITGGFGFLGSALVETLLKSFATVCIIDIKEDSEKLQHFKTLSSKISFYQGDITSTNEIEKILQKISEDYKHIDVLINNAYPRNAHYGRIFEEIELVDWQDNINSHLGGYFNVTQLVTRHMIHQNSGSIINICSIYGIVGPDFSIYNGTKMTMPAEYSAIKGGLVNFTRYLATYFGRHGIRANAVSPGGIFDNQDPSFVENYKRKVPLGRMATPQDICGAVLFLASDASQYITGQNIVVDGGLTAW